MKKVVFHTLGCKVNQYETEAMEELFENKGYQIADENEIADIYVINTCTVTNLSDRKSRQIIRRSKKKNSEAVIAVVGCYSQVSPEEISDIEGVDLIIGTTERNRIVDLCEEAKDGKVQINIVRDLSLEKEFEAINIDTIREKTRAYMKIQDGCNQFCTYCIIPYARGPIRSRELGNIVEESRKLAQAGFKEIVFTGIHIASYGKDNSSNTLIEVLEEVAKVGGIERIRFSSLEPRLINDEFMKSLVNIGKICDHFHLSLQSGSNSVLKRMNRRYTSEEYKSKVDTIRKHMPNAAITTDIIVGFPGESDDEFEDTISLVKEIGFSRIHVFKYSPREGTPAADYKDQIHGSVKNHRSELLIEHGEEMMKDFNSQFIGDKLSVLFEETSRDGDYIEGYTSNYIRVKSKGDKKILGSIETVKILFAENDYLIADIED